MTPIEKILYKSAYKFNLEYCNGTEESAHQAGIDEIKRINKLREHCSNPQKMVDLSTGRIFMGYEH